MEISDQLIQIQKKIKHKIHSIQKIKQEIDCLSNIFENVMKQIKQSLFLNIISQVKFTELNQSVEEIFQELKKIMIQEITVKELHNTLILQISKIKLNLINLIKKCGCVKIKYILQLLLTDKQINFIQSHKYYTLLNNYFHPIEFSLYTKKNEILQKSINKKIITITKLKYIKTHSLIEKLFGATVYISIEKHTLIVIKGYFNQDSINLTRLKPPLQQKNKILISLIKNNIEYPIDFQTNYLEQISLRDFVIHEPSDLLQTIQNNYNLLQKLKKNNIATTVTDFLTQPIEKQINIISLFLLNKDTQYLAYILYDMIHNNTYILKEKSLSEKVYFTFHWCIQKLFTNSFKKLNSITNTHNFNIDKIPYDKRITLMNTTQETKNKAFSKLKEIQFSKGETNAKAQQYLDAILKIPFNIYKKESIMISLSTFIDNIQVLCSLITKKIIKESDSLVTLSNKFNNNKNHTSKYLEDFITQFIKIVHNTYLLNNKNLSLFLKKKKVFELKSILKENNLSYSGKKNTLITELINNYFLLYSNNKKFFQKVSINQIVEKTTNLYKEWNEYIIKRKDYLHNIDVTLNEAVYGMKNAKLQIKRIKFSCSSHK